MATWVVSDKGCEVGGEFAAWEIGEEKWGCEGSVMGWDVIVVGPTGGEGEAVRERSGERALGSDL